MAGYALSSMLVIILLLTGIRYLMKVHFPDTYKVSVKLLRLISRSVTKLVKRLGFGRSLMMMYLLFAVTLTLAIQGYLFHDFYETMGKLVIIWSPPLGIRRALKFLQERRERVYRLPGRR